VADRDEPIRQRSLRAHNLGLVLRHVAASPRPVSRADVAGGSGLTKATVSTLVDELIAGGLLVEVDPPPRTGAGRPAVGLRLATRGPAGLGLEVNVDYLAVAVLDLTGARRHHARHPVDQRGRPAEAVLDDLADLAASAVEAASADGLRVAGVAVAVPGLVAGGVVRAAPNLDWHDVDVAAGLGARAARVGVSLDAGGLSVDNEANLAALSELHAVAPAATGAEPPSFLYISGEIGIGAGLVLEGRLLRGARGYGGELGHVTIRPDGAGCRCGARGCLEAYANQEVLLRTAGLDPGDPPAALARLAALARAGAPAALMALDEVGSAIGVAAADVVNLLDLDTVILGGIYAPLAPWLTGPVGREITERAITSPWAPVTVRASALGTAATVVGAAGSVIRAILDAPAPHLTPTPA
jgi:predicted NBD/HSP70 family sugar kinase